MGQSLPSPRLCAHKATLMDKGRPWGGLSHASVDAGLPPFLVVVVYQLMNGVGCVKEPVSRRLAGASACRACALSRCCGVSGLRRRNSGACLAGQAASIKSG